MRHSGRSTRAADNRRPSPYNSWRRTPFLLASALPVFLIPASRSWVRAHAVLALDFPATTTRWGWRVQAASDYTPIPLLGHPGFYILLACLLGYLTYRAVGLWEGTDSSRLIQDWVRSLPQASLSILLLAAVATVLIDTGMVSTLARGMTEVTGSACPFLAPWVGAIGSFMTGSTTTSNACSRGCSGMCPNCWPSRPRCCLRPRPQVGTSATRPHPWSFWSGRQP